MSYKKISWINKQSVLKYQDTFDYLMIVYNFQKR